MTDTTTPRCPSCGAALVPLSGLPDLLVCPQGHEQVTPAHVPCPACGGGFLHFDYCELCRNRRTVPPDLAAALGDGDEEAE